MPPRWKEKKKRKESSTPTIVGREATRVKAIDNVCSWGFEARVGLLLFRVEG